MANAKLFTDWALSKEGQEVAAATGSFQTPTNVNARIPPEAIRKEDVKLIDYDFVKYGSEQMRNQLIDRWVKEVKPVKR